MSIRKITAILKKQIKDTVKNKEVLIQFIMFPILSAIMQYAINIEDMPENYFVLMFATMYIGMAPLISMAAIISEEKEKNTLRVLMMSNVKSIEYLIGVGIYIFVFCMMGAAVFAITGNYAGKELAEFLLIMAVGIITSILVGAVIGTWSRNQMAATSVTVPVMLVFSFLPMLSMFNDKIEMVSKFFYSQQISNMMNAIGTQVLKPETVIVTALNLLCVIFLFTVAYRKCGLA